MTGPEQLTIDRVVRAGLRCKPWESLVEASQRVLRTPHAAHRRRLAAHVLLSNAPAWKAMSLAALILGGPAI